MAKKTNPSVAQLVGEALLQASTACLEALPTKKKNGRPITDSDADQQQGKLVVARESVSVRFRAEQLQKVRLLIAAHRAETGRRITLQEAIENGLQLWMDMQGIE
jgi:hypothetical protein